MSTPISSHDFNEGPPSSSRRQLGRQYHSPDNLPSEDVTTEMLRSRITWPDDTESCWSDAATADAVLSLLRKEPVVSPSSDTSGSGRGTPDQLRLPCAVCFRYLRNDSYPDSLIAAGCDHSAMSGMQICKNCLRRSLDIQFSSSNLGPLTCPLCHKQLSNEEIQAWASKETFDAYDQMQTWQILEEDAEFVTCIRQDCGYGQLHAGGLEDPIVICGSCGTRTCFIHRHSVWHDGLTCSEYEEFIHDEGDDAEGHSGLQTHCQVLPDVHALKYGSSDWTIEEAMSMRTIAETARPCPSCHAATERSGGCKHMICTCVAVQ
jgi:hypothetical protein